MLGEGLDVVVAHGFAVEQRLNVREKSFLLVFHVAANLLSILVVEAHDEVSQMVVLAQALFQFATDEGQLEVEVIGMAGLQIVE